VGIVAARELLKVAQSYEREGLGTRAETASVEANLAQAALLWTQLRRGVEQARLALAQVLSLPPGVPFAIDAALPPPRPLLKPAEIGGLEQGALLARPELRVQDRERRIAADDAHAQFARMLPRLDALLGFNWSTMSTAVHPAYFQYGFQVTDSLLNGGSQWWQYEMAGKTEDVEAERTLLLSLGVLFEVDFRVLQLYTAYDAMKARETVVAAQLEALKQMVSRYVQGLETGNDAVFSLAQMYLARLNLDQVQTDYQTAWIELETAALPGTSAPAPPEGDAPKPLQPFRLSPTLDSLQQVLEAAPPVDLHQYPEIKSLLESAGIGGTPGK
jgi:outer membrane protein TolC